MTSLTDSIEAPTFRLPGYLPETDEPDPLRAPLDSVKLSGATPALVIFDEVARWLETGALDDVPGGIDVVVDPGLDVPVPGAGVSRAVGVARVPRGPRSAGDNPGHDAPGSPARHASRDEAGAPFPEARDHG